MQLFVDGKAHAFMGYPPESQELRTRKIGHVVVSTTVDHPWSPYFCYMLIASLAFVRRYPTRLSARSLRS